MCTRVSRYQPLESMGVMRLVCAQGLAGINLWRTSLVCAAVWTSRHLPLEQCACSLVSQLSSQMRLALPQALLPMHVDRHFLHILQIEVGNTQEWKLVRCILQQCYWKIAPSLTRLHCPRPSYPFRLKLPLLWSSIQQETFKGENFRELEKNTIFVEKTFVDCLLVPRQGTAHPQISRRKLLRTATKTRNSQRFSPSKVSRYTV